MWIPMAFLFLEFVKEDRIFPNHLFPAMLFLFAFPLTRKDASPSV